MTWQHNAIKCQSQCKHTSTQLKKSGAMTAHREHLLDGSMIELQQGELFFHTDFPYDCV